MNTLQVMGDDTLFDLCSCQKWGEVRDFLASDALNKDKKRQQLFRCREEHAHDDGVGFLTCLHHACEYGADEDIIKSMIDIGGKELVMVMVREGIYLSSAPGGTALHRACREGASIDVIMLLIGVGGKELVMAKDGEGYTALHELCCSILDTHENAASIIKLMLEVAGIGTLLTKNNKDGETPLDILDGKALDEIKTLLQPHIKNEPSNARDDSSSKLVPADDGVNNTTTITRTLQDQLKEANQKIADLQEKLLLRERNLEEENAS
jgi:ankyrin repeat protein